MKTAGDDIGTMIDIGSSRLRICCRGQGEPVVVIEAGLGDGVAGWVDVQNRIAAFTRVCAYDRAGVGKSSPGPKPRTSRQMLTELRALLHQARIPGPYVLVGHSLGGLNVQLFAAAYPEEVAGMVLVDPTPADSDASLKPLLGKFGMLLWNSQFAAKAEGMTKRDFAASCVQVTAAGRLPPVPLVVISAGQPVTLPGPLNRLFPGAVLVAALQESHAALARQAGQGRHVIAETSTHASVRQNELVVESVRAVIGASGNDFSGGETIS